MKLLFSTAYPKELVNATRLIFEMDQTDSHTIVRYDSLINDEENTGAILFITDSAKKGLEITTRDLSNDGFNIFAYKRRSKEKINFFDFSMTFLHLLPQMIEAIRNNNSHFIYTYTYKSKRINKAKI